MFPSTGIVGGPGGRPFGLLPIRYKGDSSNNKHATTKAIVVDVILEIVLDHHGKSVRRDDQWKHANVRGSFEILMHFNLKLIEPAACTRFVIILSRRSIGAPLALPASYDCSFTCFDLHPKGFQHG